MRNRALVDAVIGGDGRLIAVENEIVACNLRQVLHISHLRSAPLHDRLFLILRILMQHNKLCLCINSCDLMSCVMRYTTVFPVARLVRAFTLAVSLAVQAGGREPAVRLVAVQGTRVHLRSGVPLQLDHAHVTRHLTRGQTVSVDKISYGITAAGSGMDGVWLHGTSVRDPKISGWICARYVSEVATVSAQSGRETPQE